jgi:hypothetical protein
MATQEEIDELANHFSEWTNDNAPLGLGEYQQAAAAWFRKQEAKAS